MKKLLVILLIVAMFLVAVYTRQGDLLDEIDRMGERNIYQSDDVIACKCKLTKE